MENDKDVYLDTKVIFNGKKLKEFRKSKGLSQENLCYDLDLTSGHISRLESGKFLNPRLDTLYKFVSYFKVPLEDFVIIEQ